MSKDAGHTDNFSARLAQHQQGVVGRYTAARRPVHLVWCEAFPTRDDACAADNRDGLLGEGRAHPSTSSG
ncbi:GIY-YIG nuclease family protein [Novosphingobium acidiphilum]|uniref:GIY-YIG nuclease family protein n=1 Tax=Novosphingobium acidiphilum TaxID=505248 RepID=UPI00248095CA|nr:GIY-YIG nuclease family protein [Novosphingobium acidiphilum]